MCFRFQDCVHIVVPVWLLNCEESTDLGVAQYCVPAVAYVAKDHRTHTSKIYLVLSICSISV